MTESSDADAIGSTASPTGAPKLILDALSNEQQAAVGCDEHPLRILAGPGAGKTRVLTNRIARRVQEGTADARRVLALTFTRRAANELRNRLNKMGIRDLGGVGTFHSTALSQIRQYRADHGKRMPTVLAGRRPILAQLMEDFPDLQLRMATIEIDWLNSQNLTAEEYRNGPGGRRVGEKLASQIASLQNGFVTYKKRRGLLDFDDILIECTSLLKSDKAFRDSQH